MRYYMGIDGGGSKTLAYVIDAEGHVLGIGHGGKGNHQTGLDETKQSLQTSTSEALAKAGLKKEELTYTVFGLAGADRPVDFAVLDPLTKDELDYQASTVVCDTDIALMAGSGSTELYGIISICGYGTNCLGVNASGERYQCGGFGYTFGDHCGGEGLATETFRQVIRAWDGRSKETALTPLVLDAFQKPCVKRLYNDALDEGIEIPANLAELLFEAEKTAQDPVAIEILELQGYELALAINATAKKLKMTHEAYPLVLSGSILTRGMSPSLMHTLESTVREVSPHAKFHYLQVEPVLGSLLLAMNLAGESKQQIESARKHLEKTLHI